MTRHTTPRTTPPNLLLICADHFRGDATGHVGHPAAATPHLDRLVATEAVGFRHAYCQNGVCTPSRCSFMSGWYPHVRGHRTMFHMLRPDEPCLLRSLKQAGYHVVWAGKNDLVPGQDGFESVCDQRIRVAPPRRYGMKDRQSEWRGRPGDDRYYAMFAGRLDTGGDDVYEDQDWHNVRAVIDVLRAPPPEPWCLFLALSEPDTPYGVEEPWFSMIDRGKLPPRVPPAQPKDGKPSILMRMAERYNLGTWTEARFNELRATYLGLCSRTDHHVGMLLDALRKGGAWDQTAVAFFSDHGDYTGDFGVVDINQNTFEDCLTRVPLVIKPPADVPTQPRVTDALVELIDIPATVEALAGLTPNHTHFGRSLLPLLAGETDEHRDAVFCEGGRLHGERHCMELESVTSHEPDSIYWPRVGLYTSEGPEHGKGVMCRTRDFKYVQRLYEADELYDLRVDPREQHNRIDDPTLSDVRERLRDRLLRFWLETADAVPHDPDRR